MLLVSYLAVHPAVFVAACAALGLIVGSFLNVVVYRLPRMLERRWRAECQEVLADSPGEDHAERYDLVVPRSHCPSCATPVRVRDNVPVLSYLWLRGRCAACGWRIPLRYPLVEALSGVLCAAVAWRFGFGVEALAGIALTWVLIALAFIDADTQLLPDAITLPALWLGLLLNLAGVFTALPAAVLGAAAGYGVLWLVYHAFRLLTGKEGMGYGDFKLLALLGAWLGWQALPAIVLLSSLAGAILGLAILTARRQGRGVPIPFGPYLAAGGWLAMMWGPQLNDAYLRLSGLHP